MEKEWENEPDKKEGEYKGMKYLILRPAELGPLCGYVQIPNSSKLADISYENIDLDVHGGLTYGGTPKGQEGYWLGFDCAHSGDFSPYMAERGYSNDGTYKNMEYVEKECKHMIDQLKKGVKVRVMVEKKIIIR